MKSQLALLALAFVGMTALVWTQGNDANWVTFESARKIESVDGDLRRAAELYEPLTGSPDRELAERSRRQLAGISRKLGHADTQAAASAQSRAAVASPTLKRVCSVDCGWGEVAVSPNGRRIVWREPTSTALILQEISNGRRSNLTTDADGGMDILWSPDDAHVAFRTPGALNASQARVLDVRNGRFRDITVGKPLAWSADGKKLLIASAGTSPTSPKFSWVAIGREGAEEPLTIPLRDFVISTASGVRGRGFSSPLHEGTVKVSPDGKFIAYNSGRSLPSGDVKTFVARVDGSGSVVTSDSPDVEFPIGWTPDSRYLLYRRQSAAGALSLWAVHVLDGRPQGAPIAIRRDLGQIATVSVVGLARSGTLFFRKRSEEADTYAAPLDAASGQITAQPRPLPIPTPVAGRNGMARFSPDGQQIAYINVERTAPGTPRAYAGPGPALRLFSFVTGQERQLATDYGVNATGPLCWTAAGDSLVFLGGKGNDASTADYQRLNVTSGAVIPAGGDMGRCSNLAYALTTGMQLRRIGETVPRQIHTFQTPDSFAPATRISHDATLSRAGRHLAFKERLADSTIVLRVVPVDGGSAVELARGADLDVPNGIAWSGDDRFVFFCRRFADGTIETFRVAANGGMAVSTGYKGPGAGDIDVSPDGTRLMSAWGSWGEFEIWSMESFLPPAR